MENEMCGLNIAIVAREHQDYDKARFEDLFGYVKLKTAKLYKRGK